MHLFLPREGAAVAAASIYCEQLKTCGLPVEIIFSASEYLNRNKHSTLGFYITTESTAISRMSASAEIPCC
jgi:hypothetical protein